MEPAERQSQARRAAALKGPTAARVFPLRPRISRCEPPPAIAGYLRSFPAHEPTDTPTRALFFLGAIPFPPTPIPHAVCTSCSSAASRSALPASLTLPRVSRRAARACVALWRLSTTFRFPYTTDLPSLSQRPKPLPLRHGEGDGRLTGPDRSFLPRHWSLQRGLEEKQGA